LPEEVRRRGIEVVGGSVVSDVRGRSRVSAAQVMSLDEAGQAVIGEARSLSCDLLVISGGWSPAVHLHAHARGRPRWDDATACFVPGESFEAERSAGAANGSFELGDCLAEGLQAGAQAAREAGLDAVQAPQAPTTEALSEEPIRPLWLVPRPSDAKAKRFVDLQNDTSAADIELAVREGYTSVEHVKRYTAMGFGTDQGKLGNVNGMAILAQTLGADIAATGTTTFRPAYTPVTFGALAGREVGELFDPVRKTAMHTWHEQAGAKFENVAQWHRPWFYPRGDETLHQAVDRECLATRRGIGVLDASTLGKIDIQGPDAAELLNRIYTNGWTKLGVGRCRYGLMLGEDGMVMDDGVTARLAEQHFLMTTTTGGAAHVMGWLEQWLQTEWPDLKVYLTSVTDHWATVAVAGPYSRSLIGELCPDIDFSRDAFPFMSLRHGTVARVPARVVRVSFTGELSYEINVPANYGLHLWQAVMKAGAKYDATPFGTETMHVLRAEKGFIIVGQDTDGSVTPDDLGMSWIVSSHKDFLGRRSLAREDTVRADRKHLVGLFTEDPGQVLPEGAQLVAQPAAHTPVPMLGHVTSSYPSANLGRSIALALIRGGRERIGETVYAPLDTGKIVPAVVTQPLFYDPQGVRQHV
jgi:sarcosine oxidase subunit alpha